MNTILFSDDLVSSLGGSSQTGGQIGGSSQTQGQIGGPNEETQTVTTTQPDENT